MNGRLLFGFSRTILLGCLILLFFTRHSKIMELLPISALIARRDAAAALTWLQINRCHKLKSFQVRVAKSPINHT